MKKSLRHRRKSKSLRSKRRAHRVIRNKTRRLRGGNYERDVTTRTYEGFPMKPLNKVVTSVPGRGVMSVTAYKQLKIGRAHV